MAWARLDDGLIDHPKFNELLDEADGWAAFGFWSAMLIWANKHTRKPGRTPGLLRRADVSRMDRGNSGRFAGLLVKCGFWELRDEGWQIHDFEQYLPSERKLAAQRANAALGGKAKAANRALATGQKNVATGQEELPTGVPSSSHAPGTGKGSSSSTGSRIAEGGAGGDKNATRIPPGFKVTPEMVTWARETVPHVDGRAETEKFIDHFTAASGAVARKKDWVAAWRNWMRNADERLGRNGSRPLPRQDGLGEGFWER